MAGGGNLRRRGMFYRRANHMGKIPENLRLTIAANIRACRMEKFPGRGGGKKCAEAFGVSPQQWSPWERGMRTPDETRLEQIAKFFGKTVEYMRRDNRPPAPGAPSLASEPQVSHGADAAKMPREIDNGTLVETVPESPPYAHMSAPELLVAMQRDKVKAIYQVEVSVASVRFVRCGGPAGI